MCVVGCGDQEYSSCQNTQKICVCQGSFLQSSQIFTVIFHSSRSENHPIRLREQSSVMETLAACVCVLSAALGRPLAVVWVTPPTHSKKKNKATKISMFHFIIFFF